MCFGGDFGMADDDSAAKTRPGEEAGGEARTYRAAMGPIEQRMGGQKSDQDIENDQRVTEALGSDPDPNTGERMFDNVITGQRQSVGSYSRESTPVAPGSVLDSMNQPATLGLFKAASLLAPFPFSIPASIVGGRIDKSLGTGFTLGGKN